MARTRPPRAVMRSKDCQDQLERQAQSYDRIIRWCIGVMLTCLTIVAGLVGIRLLGLPL